jgi:hypothetical protein
MDYQNVTNGVKVKKFVRVDWMSTEKGENYLSKGFSLFQMS